MKASTITVRIRPSSDRDEVVGYDSERGALMVKVRAPPEKGRANAALIKLLRKHFRKEVEIISGLKGRKKIIRVS